MKTTIRVLVVAAAAATQWWATAGSQPLIRAVDAYLRQVAPPEAIANAVLRVHSVVRSLRSAS